MVNVPKKVVREGSRRFAALEPHPTSAYIYSFSPLLRLGSEEVGSSRTTPNSGERSLCTLLSLVSFSSRVTG